MADYRRLASNTLATLAGRLASIVLALVLSTVLFYELGPSEYGVWSFFFVAIGYASFLDLGLGATVERFVARAHWAGDRAEIERILNLGLTFSLGVSLVFEAVVLVIRPEWFNRSTSASLRPILRAFPLCLLMTNASSVMGAGLGGIQRMTVLNLLRSASNAAGTTSVVLLAGLGFRRLDLLLLVYAGWVLVAGVLSWVVLARTVGELRPRFLFFERRLAREFCRFGGAVQTATLAPQVADQTFRLLLGVRFGIAAMGVFDLGSRAALALRSVVSSLLVAMVPFGTSEYLSLGSAGVSRLHRFAVKYIGLFLLPATVLALYHSRELVNIWLRQSPGTEGVLLVFRIFLVVHALAALAGPATMLARAAARTVPEAVMLVVGVVGGLAVSAAVPVISVALAVYGGASVVASLVLWQWLKRLLQLERGSARDLAAIVGLSVGTLIATRLVDLLLSWQTLLVVGPTIGLLLSAGVAVAVTFAGAWGVGIVASGERRFWRSVCLGSWSAEAPPGLT
jgi:O-antigen/teichoic acid export membrane protein